jgi:hypothetical protein
VINIDPDQIDELLDGRIDEQKPGCHDGRHQLWIPANAAKPPRGTRFHRAVKGFRRCPTVNRRARKSNSCS